MKIAIITSRYPSEGNPYNHMFVHMRSKEFVKQGEHVQVLVPAKSENEYIFEGINVKQMPSNEIIKSMKEYDIMYLHLLHLYPLMRTDGWPIYKAIMQKQYPFAMYVHGSEFTFFKARFFNDSYSIRDFVSWLRKDIYHMPRLIKFFSTTHHGEIITPSNWMKKKINNILNYSKINIIPNGIDVNLFKYRKVQRGFRIISLRPLGDKVYDIESTINVLSLLPDHYSLDIYGKGKYKQHYNNIIKDKGLSDRIKIYDAFIERKDMPVFFRDYNVFISTTKLDSQGITMLEAMSCGLLVSSIDNSSKKEFIIDMKTGILAETPKELADKILEVTSDQNLFENITLSGRKSMEEINVEITCKEELNILKKIANKK